MTSAYLLLHIPDGFLSPGICLLGWILAFLVLHLAIRHSREQLAERQVAFAGIIAAFVFAAQAINFPIVGGTSGHILGGALTGILIGPWAGTLVMTAVIIVQGLIFQDGGLLSMGWNILNMGAGSVLTGYFVYDLLLRSLGDKPTVRVFSGFAAAWISVQVGAVATALQLAASGTFPIHFALPALTSIYALVGIAEGIVTVAALRFIKLSYPEALRGERAPGRVSAAFFALGLAGALMLALLSPLASSSPDGLERVAESGGIDPEAGEPLISIFPDYTVSLFENPDYSTVVAMVIGTLLVCGMVLILGQYAKSFRAGEPASPHSTEADPPS